jgi:hypothetical protein
VIFVNFKCKPTTIFGAFAVVHLVFLVNKPNHPGLSGARHFLTISPEWDIIKV